MTTRSAALVECRSSSVSVGRRGVKTDDIFVLLLIAMCVAAIVAMAVHSRRE